MKHKETKLIFLLLLMVFISFVFSSCHDNIFDTHNRDRDDDDRHYSDNVNNTNYVAIENITHRLSASNRTKFRLKGINGNIIIRGTTGSDSVIIMCEKQCASESTMDAKNHLYDIIVDIQNYSNEIFIRTIQPDITYGRQYTVNYTVYIPNNMEVYTDNVNGAIQVDNFNNYVSTNNVNGNIYLSNINASSSISIVNGNIDCRQILPLNGKITLSTVNGNIKLDIPNTTSAELSANTVNGGISYNNLNFSSHSSAINFLQGILGSGQGRISMNSVNGRISISGF